METVAGNIFCFDWEVSLMKWIQSNLGRSGQAVFRALTYTGSEMAVLLLFLILYFCYKKEAGKRVGLTAIAASVWCPMIKNAVCRLRPYMAHTREIECLEPVSREGDLMNVRLQGYSFPSMHSTIGVIMYGDTARILKKRWTSVAGIILPFLIGISRIALGVHYPTDVLAGWAIGAVTIGLAILLEKKIRNESIRYLILLATAIPGIFFCTGAEYFTSLGLLAGMTVTFPFERKHVNFADTRRLLAMALRVAGGGILYYLGNMLLKIPFNSAYLAGGTLGANLVRTGRYMLLVFLIAGVYPMCFRFFEKKWPRAFGDGK